MVASLLAPLAYITVLVAGMLLFSRYQRSRTKAAITAIEPWFPSHPSRDLYISLLQHEPPLHDQMLMSALLVRATEDVRRIWKIRDAKSALQILIQRGSLGDDTSTRFAAAEKELEAEVIEVVAEANTFKPGWGQWIFASASEMATKDKVKQVYRDIENVRVEEEKRLQARKALKSQSSNSTSTDAPSTSEPTTSIMSPPPVSSVTPAITTALDTPTKPTRTAAGVNILIESEEMSRRGSTISDSGSAGGSGNTSIVGSPAKNGTPGKNKKKGKKK